MEWWQTGWWGLASLPIGALLGAVVARRHGKWADQRDLRKAKKRESDDADFAALVRRSLMEPRYFQALVVGRLTSILGDAMTALVGLGLFLAQLILVVQRTDYPVPAWLNIAAWVGAAGCAAFA